MRGFSEQLHAAAKKTTPGFETTSTCDVGVRLNYMKQVGPALLQVIHIKNKMQETVGVVSSASALVIPPFCKLSQPYSVGLGSTRRWTSAVLGARSRASTLLVARDAGRIPTVGDFSRQHRATRPKGCGASWERGWVFSFRHTLSNLGQQTCNYTSVMRHFLAPVVLPACSRTFVEEVVRIGFDERKIFPRRRFSRVPNSWGHAKYEGIKYYF